MDKPTILLSFQKNGKNGGPYLSHQRIMDSELNKKYNFVPIYLPRFRELIKPKVFNNLVKEIRESKAQIFQFTGLQLDGFMSLRLAKKAKIRNICAIRGSTGEAVYVKRLMKFIVSKLEKRTLKKADACYAVSSYVENWPITRKYANNLFGHIYNFFDFSSEGDVKTDYESIREEFGIKSTDVVVVSTGRIILEKGFGTIKDIVLQNKLNGDVKFLIVGEGNYKEDFIKSIKDNNLENKVIFTGYRKDIDRILNACDIYLSCTWHETFGNSVIEASYHSLPVVASNVGGVPEIIDDGKTGFLIEYKDINAFISKIKLLCEDNNLRKKMGKAGYDYVKEKFNPRFIEEKLDKLYQYVLNIRLR